jgi:hypothetical protein
VSTPSRPSRPSRPAGPADPAGPAGPAGPADGRRRGEDVAPTSPVDALLTPPGSSPTEEPTQGLPVSLHTLAGGRYVLGRQLGAGGMGLVRVAHDEVLHREVAVKLLADNLAMDTEARERFLREARAAARIHDPHVVAVHDVGDEAGRPYLVMELVDGPSLADVLATEGKLDPHEVVEIAAQALAGIARAHDAGLLHRDVKPGNLLRHPDGTIKVTDFGVAEAADAPGLTRTGFVIGTRSYLAPERRRGASADARTDLYALGATLVELLTGRPPGDERVELPGDAPTGLARLVGKLLAEDPDDRPADTQEALEILAGGGSTTAEEAFRAIDDDTALAAPTVDLGPRPSAEGVAAPAAGTTEQLPVERDDDATAAADAGSSFPWRTVAMVGLALLVLLVVLQFTTGGGEEPGDGDPPQEDVDAGAEDAGTEADAGADPEPVERVEDDPESTARNLADWLRERSGPTETGEP